MRSSKEESKANILKQYSHYIDRLVVFHTDTMELLRHIDYHYITPSVGTDNRLATKAKIEALIKQGKEVEYEVCEGLREAMSRICPNHDVSHRDEIYYDGGNDTYIQEEIQ